MVSLSNSARGGLNVRTGFNVLTIRRTKELEYSQVRPPTLLRSP